MVERTSVQRQHTRANTTNKPRTIVGRIAYELSDVNVRFEALENDVVGTFGVQHHTPVRCTHDNRHALAVRVELMHAVKLERQQRSEHPHHIKTTQAQTTRTQHMR